MIIDLTFKIHTIRQCDLYVYSLEKSQKIIIHVVKYIHSKTWTQPSKTVCK